MLLHELPVILLSLPTIVFVELGSVILLRAQDVIFPVAGFLATFWLGPRERNLPVRQPSVVLFPTSVQHLSSLTALATSEGEKRRIYRVWDGNRTPAGNPGQSPLIHQSSVASLT